MSRLSPGLRLQETGIQRGLRQMEIPESGQWIVVAQIRSRPSPDLRLQATGGIQPQLRPTGILESHRRRAAPQLGARPAPGLRLQATAGSQRLGPTGVLEAQSKAQRG